MKRILLILVLIFVLVFGVQLIKNRDEEIIDPNKLQVTTSFYPLYFLASKIGGDKTQVTNITPPGAEPHDYDLTPTDIIKIQNSKLLVLNGFVEPWIEKLKNNLKNKDVELLITDKELATQKITENGVDSIDPHTWLSPRLIKIEAQKITEALQKIDPKNSQYFELNRISLNKELDALHLEYKMGLTNCKTRTFVTSHKSFGYIAHEYNLKEIAIAGVSPDAEPSIAALAEITDLVRKNDIKYIFFESLVNPKLSQTIADEIGAQTLVLDPIEGIQESELLKGTNYLTLMHANLQNLRKALECK